MSSTSFYGNLGRLNLPSLLLQLYNKKEKNSSIPQCFLSKISMGNQLDFEKTIPLKNTKFPFFFAENTVE